MRGSFRILSLCEPHEPTCSRRPEPSCKIVESVGVWQVIMQNADSVCQLTSGKMIQ